MPDTSCLIEMVGGVPVVTGPAEIDVSTLYRLRTALLEAAAHGQATVVVDLTQTRFCDSAGLGILIRAHKRALAAGGEVRLVLPDGGAVSRIVTLTSLYRYIPRFASLSEALRPGSAAAPPPRVRLGPGPLEASVADEASGPVITLYGEADLTSAAQLSTLITAHLSGGTRHLTIDVSQLSFADSATVQALVLAARTLNKRGGSLALRHPQPAVARVLALTGADQMFATKDDRRLSPGPPGSRKAPDPPAATTPPRTSVPGTRRSWPRWAWPCPNPSAAIPRASTPSSASSRRSPATWATPPRWPGPPT